jgi:hypothetical protein
MEEDKQNKGSSKKIFCPISKHKFHCSQIEGTEASELPEEKRYEFCLNKCPIYKRHKGTVSDGNCISG